MHLPLILICYFYRKMCIEEKNQGFRAAFLLHQVLAPPVSITSSKLITVCKSTTFKAFYTGLKSIMFQFTAWPLRKFTPRHMRKETHGQEERNKRVFTDQALKRLPQVCPWQPGDCIVVESLCIIFSLTSSGSRDPRHRNVI